MYYDDSYDDYYEGGEGGEGGKGGGIDNNEYKENDGYKEEEEENNKEKEKENYRYEGETEEENRYKPNILDNFKNLNTFKNMSGGGSGSRKINFSFKGIKNMLELKDKIIYWFRSLFFKLNNFRHDFKDDVLFLFKKYKYAIILIIIFFIFFLYSKIRSVDTYKGYGKLKIVVTNFDSDYGIKRCLKSIKNQKYKYYDVVVVDDSSRNLNQWKFIQRFCKKNSWKCLRTSRNVGSLYCYVLGINAHRCKLNDVIVMIDGDDWLISNDAFKIVRNAYRSDSELCLTFGNYLNFVSDLRKYQVPSNTEIINNNLPYIDKIIMERNYRKEPWIYFPMRTFKYFIWKKLDQKRLIDRNGIGNGKGKMYRIATDRILMYPLLEIANGRIKFINEFIYAYNIHMRNIDKFQESEEFEEKTRIIRYLRDEEPHESPLEKVFFYNKKKSFFDRMIEKNKNKKKNKK